MNSIAPRTRHACALSWALLTLAGCGGSATDNLPRQAVTGTVTLDGKPLEAGAITFDPADMGQSDAVSGGAPISSGSYSIARATGLTPGKYRVSIAATAVAEPVSATEGPGVPPKATRKAPAIPARYNTQSTLTAEVKPGGTGPLDFPLTSK